MKNSLLLLFVFFLPFQVFHKLGFMGPKTFLCIADLLLIALIGLCGFRTFRFEGAKKYCLAFVLLSFTSFALAKGDHSYWNWFQFALPFIAYLFVNPRRSMKALCWILFAASLLQVGLVLAQYILQHSVGFKSLGESRLACDASASIAVQSKTRWIFDHWTGFVHRSIYILRPAGTFPHPNILGGFLGMCILATCYLFLKTRRWWVGVGLALQTFGLLLTYSRGALFGVIGASVLLLLRVKSRGVLRLALLLTLSLGMGGLILKEQIDRRGGIVSQTKSATASDQARIYYQGVAKEMGKEKPLLGHGWGNYEKEQKRVAGEDPLFNLMTVHNIYFLIFAEGGALGLMAFLAFLGSLAVSTWKMGRNPEASTLFAMGAFIVWFGLVDHFWLTMVYGRGMLLMTAALISVYAKQEQTVQSIPVH